MLLGNFLVIQEAVTHSLEDAPQSMYVFEGTDYSAEPTNADRKAFEELLAGMYSLKVNTYT